MFYLLYISSKYYMIYTPENVLMFAGNSIKDLNLFNITIVNYFI